MGNDLSIWTLVLDASPIVQGVMLILLGASVASWAVIFKKSRVISHSRRQAQQFETAFWSGGDLSALYRSIETKGRAGTGEQLSLIHISYPFAGAQRFMVDLVKNIQSTAHQRFRPVQHLSLIHIFAISAICVRHTWV